MDFLGVGPIELLVVVIIALIVVGPERLPQIAQSVGKTLRELRAMSQGLTAEWQQELNSATGAEFGKHKLQQSLTEPIKDLQKVLTEPLKDAQEDIYHALNEPLTSPTDAAAKPVPSKTPPSTSDTLNDDVAQANT